MINIAIAGYGSIGRGVEYAIERNDDTALTAIFTRRPAASVAPRTNTPVIPMDQASQWAGKVDVLILCGGSFADLPVQGPMLARHFHTVDSFDTHAEIPRYFAEMDAALKASGRLGIIAAGWDPGLFSLNRLYMSAMLPQGESHTFWGRGISQGHSNAIRQIEGVADAVQYTCPIEDTVAQVRSGAMPKLTARQKHTRECYVVLRDGADAARVERDIITMPHYFADYETHVRFISQEELSRDYASAATKGIVFRNGCTGKDNVQRMAYSLDLASNAEFTAHALLAYARAVFRLAAKGETGALTVFDVAPALLSPQSGEEIRAEML